MRAILILLLATCIQGVALSADVAIQDPMLTLTGHYRCRDGRVSEHRFPVEIKLLANGKFTGTIESWIEKWKTDGTRQLIYFNNTFRGNWTISDKTIQVLIDKGANFPRSLIFEDFNGLRIKFVKQITPNKSDAGDGK